MKSWVGWQGPNKSIPSPRNSLKATTEGWSPIPRPCLWDDHKNATLEYFCVDLHSIDSYFSTLYKTVLIARESKARSPWVFKMVAIFLFYPNT